MQSKHDADDIDDEVYVPNNGYIFKGMFYGTRYEAEQYGPPGAAKRAKKVPEPERFLMVDRTVERPEPARPQYRRVKPPAPPKKAPKPGFLSDDERKQRHRARLAVTAAVCKGLLPRQATQSCIDCGASGPLAFIQYDHYMGYDDACFLAVEPVCRACHGRRSAAETAVRRANADAGR